MNCPKCGAVIPEGELTCPICGVAVTETVNETVNETVETVNETVNTVNDAVESVAPVVTSTMTDEAPKSNKGVIFGVIGALVAIAAIVVVLVVFVFNGGKPDGHYVCDSMAMFGLEMSLDIDGDKATMNMTMTYDGETETESEEGTCKFNGDKVTLTFDGEATDATYNKKEQTISISGEDMMGISLEFKKK